MKRLAILTFALSLSACASTNGVPTTSDISDTAKQIQAYTRTICSFVPTIATIANIISTGSAGVSAIAQDICAAVTTAPLADGSNPGLRNTASVRGVIISGRFVRR